MWVVMPVSLPELHLAEDMVREWTGSSTLVGMALFGEVVFAIGGGSDLALSKVEKETMASEMVSLATPGVSGLSTTISEAFVVILAVNVPAVAPVTSLCGVPRIILGLKEVLLASLVEGKVGRASEFGSDKTMRTGSNSLEKEIPMVTNGGQTTKRTWCL